MPLPAQLASAAIRRRRRRLWLGLIGGVLLTVGIGLAGVWWPLTQTLDRWSYDLPFLWRSPLQTDDCVVVQMDAASGFDLRQASGAAWDRRLHARLIDRLTAEGARLVVYDVLFLSPGPEPEADDALEEAIRRNGRVVLAAGARQVVTLLDGTNRVHRTQPLPPLRRFREAARGWGTASVPTEVDCGEYVRRFPATDTNVPDALPLTLAAAHALLGDEPAASFPGPERWINFRGPPGTFAAHTFSRALNQPQRYASNKVVFVGALPERGFFDTDQFAVPYTRVGRRQMPGVELHATMLSNLLQGDWLRRASPPAQTAGAGLFGLVLGAGCVILNPRRSALFSLAAVVIVAAGSLALVWTQNIWWSWLVPVAMQTPAGFLWGLGYRYFVVDQRSRRLKQAFGAYLSPVMAEQLAEQEELLALGGQEVEATVMFTDLEGFTTMSESLPPAEVSRILVAYFNATTEAILREEGTIIKYVGDAVMAVWGAPLKEPHHADRAVTAAWMMSQASKQEIAGRRLRTRIGVNTGRVLAGNLGSRFRFDYTLIGDTTNFASRLEGINKYLGTEVLISDTTQRQLTRPFLLRPLGRFQVSGKATAVGILEVLGPPDTEPPAWLMLFAQALEHFQGGRLEAAEQAFNEVNVARNGNDGPSSFYLHHLASLRGRETNAPWTGIVVLDKK